MANPLCYRSSDYQFSDQVNHPFAAPVSLSPAADDTHLHDQSLQNPLHHPRFETENFLLNPYFGGTLESAFSHLNLNSLNNDGSFCDAYGFSLEGGWQDSEQTHQASLVSSNFSPTGLNQNLFLCDPRKGGLNNNGYSITPSSNRNGFFNGAVPKKHNVMRSSFSRPQWLQQEPFNGPLLRDLRGNFLILATDHYGCRFLQNTMKNTTKEELDMIFSELIDHVCELMADPFGNYVIQKLVEVCTEEQRTLILLMLTKINFQLVRICLDMYGTRAVQRLLECLTTPQQISLVTAALSTGAVTLTKDMNGHHVIQHCLKYFSNEDNKYLLNELANNCYRVATDKSGCCVLQHCVQFCKGEPRERLVAEIVANALHLADNHYGNYVVQHILEMKVPQITIDLLRQLEGHYASLSFNKYGSNVVEKCLKVSGEQQSVRIIVELLHSPNVSMLLLDPYGNYVIQSALSISKGFLFDALRSLVKINYNGMRNNIYGRKVIAWFQKNKLCI